VLNRLHEPLSVTGPDDLAHAGKTVVVVEGRGDSRLSGVQASLREQSRDELAARRGLAREPMGGACRGQFLTPEFPKNSREMSVELRGQRLRKLRLLGGGRAPQADAEDPRQVKDALLRERAEH